MPEEGDEDVFCYGCLRSGHQDGSCRHSRDPSEPFLTNVISLTCSSIPCKTDIRAIAESLSLGDLGLMKNIRIKDSCEAIVTFSNLLGALKFNDSLRMSPPRWLIAKKFSPAFSHSLPFRHQGFKYLPALLSFDMSEEGSPKNCILFYSSSALTLSPENTLNSLRAFAESKLLKCDCRNEFEEFFLCFPSEKHLQSFFSWAIKTNKRSTHEFIQILARVGYIASSTSMKQTNPVQRGVCAYSQLLSTLEAEGFSYFMSSNQVFKASEYLSILLLHESPVKEEPVVPKLPEPVLVRQQSLPTYSNQVSHEYPVFRVSPPSHKVGICSLCFKMLSSKSTVLLQIGVEISPLEGREAALPFRQQYAIVPNGATEEELQDYGYETSSPSFVHKVNCDIFTADVEVLSEKKVLSKLVSDILAYTNSPSGIRYFFVLVHSTFISLPLFLGALAKIDRLKTFQSLSLGVLDLNNIVPLGKKILKSESCKSVLVSSLDTIYRQLSLPPRNIHDPVVLTAVRMRESLLRVLKNQSNLYQTLVKISHAELFASKHFFAKEICPECVITLENSQSKWVSLRRHEASPTDIVFIPGSEFEFEISEFEVESEYYHLRISNKKTQCLTIPMDHVLGHVVSSPGAHLCASHLNFLPPSPIPCWVGLQINACVPQSLRFKDSDEAFLTSLKVDMESSWIKPIKMSNTEPNIFLLSMKVDGVNITQISLLSIDGKEDRSFHYHYAPPKHNPTKYLRGSSPRVIYYKDINHQTLNLLEKDYASLYRDLSGIPSLILVGYNMGSLLLHLFSLLPGKSLTNLLGVVELAWCLSPAYDKIASWYELVDFLPEDLDECSQMNQISQASLQKTLNSLSFDVDNFVSLYAVSPSEFLGSRGGQANLDNCAVIKLSYEKTYVFFDIQYHPEAQKSPRCIGIKVQGQEPLALQHILPINLSRSELVSMGYTMESESWKHGEDSVTELPCAVQQILDFLSTQRTWIIIVTSTVQIRQHLYDLLSSHDPSAFKVLLKGVIQGWVDLMSSFYSLERPNTFVGVEKSSPESISILSEYFSNGRGDNNSLKSMERIFGSLSKPLIESSMTLPQGKYITFFLCVRSLLIALENLNPFINPKIIGLIGCYSVHNSHSSTLPLIPPSNACPKSIEEHHLVKNAFDLWEYSSVKQRDCHPHIKAFNFLLTTIDNEVQKMKADGALLITFTAEELSYFLASIQSNNLSKRFLEAVSGVGDISYFLQSERHLENVSSLEELHHFYMKNVDSCISAEARHFHTVTPSILTKYLTYLARYLVEEDGFHRLAHTTCSDYFNRLILDSGLLEFQEESVDIIVDKDSTIPAKSKMRVEARLRGYLFANGVDATMRIFSPNVKCPIKVEEGNVLFFKNNSSLIAIENLDKVPVQMSEGVTIIGRAISLKETHILPSKQQQRRDKNPLLKLARAVVSKRPAAIEETEEDDELSSRKKHKEEEEAPSKEINICKEPVAPSEAPPPLILEDIIPKEAEERQNDDDVVIGTLPPEEDVRHELQGFDALCMDPSFEPFLLTLLRLWSFQKKPFDHEQGDALVFRLMSVGLGLQGISKLIEEKRCASVVQLKNELFAENIVLQDMLAGSADLFFEVAGIHFLNDKARTSLKAGLGKQGNKEDSIGEKEDEPPLENIQESLENEAEEKMDGSDVSEEKPRTMILDTKEKGVDDLMQESPVHNISKLEEGPSVKISSPDSIAQVSFPCVRESSSRDIELLKVFSIQYSCTDLVNRLCLARSIRKIGKGLMVSQVSPPLVGRIFNVPWDLVYNSNHLGVIEEGLYLRGDQFVPFKHWGSFKDCVTGFIKEVREKDIIVCYLDKGSSLLRTRSLCPKRFLFYKFLSNPGQPLYLNLLRRNEPNESVLFGIPMISMDNHTYVAPPDAAKRLSRLSAFLQKGCLSLSSAVQEDKKECIICACGNASVYKAVVRVMTDPKALVKILEYKANICIRASLELSSEIKEKMGVFAFVDRSGKIALVGDVVSIGDAMKFLLTKFEVK